MMSSDFLVLYLIDVEINILNDFSWQRNLIYVVFSPSGNVSQIRKDRPISNLTDCEN